MDPIRKRLDTLSAQKRATYAAACVERVLKNYTHLGFRPDDDTSVADAVEMIWAVAGGAEVDPQACRAQQEAIKRIGPMFDDGFTESTHVAIAVAYGLDALEDGTGESTWKAGLNAVESVYSYTDEDDTLCEREEAWQERALSLIEAAADGPLTRDVLSTVSDPPEWLPPKFR